MSTEPFMGSGAVAKAAGIGRDKLRALTVAGVIPAYQPGGTEFMRWAGSVTNHHVAPIPVGRVDDMQYADLMREFSEAVAAYTMATADGNVTPGEAVHVCKQLDDVIMASHRLKISINKRSQQRQGPRTMAEAIAT